MRRDDSSPAALLPCVASVVDSPICASAAAPLPITGAVRGDGASGCGSTTQRWNAHHRAEVRDEVAWSRMVVATPHCRNSSNRARCARSFACFSCNRSVDGLS